MRYALLALLALPACDDDQEATLPESSDAALADAMQPDAAEPDARPDGPTNDEGPDDATVHLDVGPDGRRYRMAREDVASDGRYDEGWIGR